jgi:hypothetical protein
LRFAAGRLTDLALADLRFGALRFVAFRRAGLRPAIFLFFPGAFLPRLFAFAIQSSSPLRAASRQ